MPQLIAWIGYNLVMAGVPVVVLDFAIKVGFSALLSVVSSKLFGPKLGSVRRSPRAIIRRTAVDYRQVVYGKAAVSGPIIYNNTSGANREQLWYVIALCEGEIDDVTSIYVDDTEVPEVQVAWAAGSGGADGTGTGAVSTTKFVGANSANGLYLYWTHGHPDQVYLGPVASAFGSDWTSAHRARGVALLAARCDYTTDTEEVWRTGAPSNIKAVVRGSKVYDPRLDSTTIVDSTTSPITYGTGAHRTATVSTWAWSDNPALCIANYMMQYMDVPAASIDWESIAKAADDCDAQVVVPPAASPSNYETRFTCNGVLSLGTSHKDNLDILLSSCDGRLSYSRGVWKLRASVWEASSVSYDEDDLAGQIDVRGSAPKSDRSNHIRGVFMDPNEDYELVEFPIASNSTYLTRDNNVEITKDLELPMTNSKTMAQRIAFRLLEHDNNQVIAKVILNARGAKCAIGDVVDLTVSKLSWNAKTFRVIDWMRNGNGTYTVTLKEDSSATYDDPIVSDYTTRNSASITLPSEVVPPPTGFSASSVPYAIRLNWTNPASKEFDYIDVYASDTSAWSGASRIASVRTDTYTHNLGSGTVKYYWIRARRNNGDVSLRNPNSDTSTVTSTAGAGNDSVNLTGATLSDEQIAATTEVGYRLTSSGAEEGYETTAASWEGISTWLLSGAASNYECRLSKTSGTNPTSGTLATWQALSSTRTWVWTDSTQTDTPVTFEGTIEIRDVSQSPAPVYAAADVSVAIDSQTESINLSGTPGTPNLSTDADEQGIADAVSGWYFNSDGTVDRIYLGSQTQFAAGVQWTPSTPSGTYYIRATNDSGDSPNGGDSLNTWLALTSDRSWTWTKSNATTGSTSGTLKIEISTSTSPPGIVATGYYKGTSTILPGGGP